MATTWDIRPDREPPPNDRLIEHVGRIRAHTPSLRSPREADLQIGATTVRTVVVMRGWHAATLFECRCGRAVEAVYLPPDGGEPGCRHCVRVGGERLDYSSRRVGRDLPEAQRVRRLREKLGVDPTPFSEIGPRRRWQHRVPRLRILAKIAEQERRLAERLAGMTRDLERRLRVRGLTG
jgi:hypothetical protein